MPLVSWPVCRALRCPQVVPPPTASFADVIEARRSIRQMGRAPLREIVNVVAFSTRPRFSLANDDLKRTRRPTPSAGALHPFDIVLADWRGAPRLMRYDSVSHRLELLNASDNGKHLAKFARATGEILPEAHGTALVLLGDGALVDAAYENWDTLFWRDAGALLQTLFMTATAFRLAFCPLGILGHEVVRALGLAERLAPAGVAMIGRAPSADRWLDSSS